jgi:hypothetical protein
VKSSLNPEIVKSRLRANAMMFLSTCAGMFGFRDCGELVTRLDLHPKNSRQEKLDFFLQSRADLLFLFPMAIGDVTANMLLGSSSATAPPKNRLVEMLVVRHGSRGAPTDRSRGLI